MRDVARPPPPPSRIAGGLAVATATLGSGAVGLACLDVARSARFAIEAAMWEGARSPGPRSAATLVVLASLAVSVIGLATARVLARGGSRLSPAVWGTSALAVLAGLAHVRHELAHVLQHALVSDDWLGMRCASAAIAVGSTTVVIAGARSSASVPARLAPLAIVAPLLVCTVVLPSMDACVSPFARDGELLRALDALVAQGDLGRRALALALLPGLVVATTVRAGRAPAVAGVVWLALGAALVIGTRPLAADVADRTHAFVLVSDASAGHAWVGPHLHEGAVCEARVLGPTLALRGPTLDGAVVRDAATLREWLDTLRRNHAILHPRDPFRGVLVIRPEDALSRPVADDVTWLRVVDEAEYSELRIELAARATWATRSRGTLERTVRCQRTPVRPPLEAIGADPSIRWSELAGLDPRAIE